MGIGILAVIMVFGGIVAGAIGYSKHPSTGTFVAFFIFGALFPLIGILVAAFSKGPPKSVQPAGWYPDPWRQGEYRWFDGSDWTPQVSASAG